MKNNDRKKELLNIAYKMFITRGYENTSIDEIIAEAGIAKGTYYYYFKSKEETLEEVLNMMIEAEEEKARQVLELPISIPEKIVGIITALRPNISEQSISLTLHQVENIVMHQKANAKVIDVATPLLKIVIEDGINEKIFDCNYVEERIRIILLLSIQLFNDENITLGNIEVFTETVEKLLGAKKGTMDYIKTLIIGNKNWEKINVLTHKRLKWKGERKMKDIKEKLKEVTGRSEADCAIINDILNNHFIVGHNQKLKIVGDFQAKLNLTEDEADELYNQCAGIIVKGIFKRK